MKSNQCRSLFLTLSCMFVLAGLAAFAQEPREGVIYWEEPLTETAAGESFIQNGPDARKAPSCGDGVQQDGDLCFITSTAWETQTHPLTGLDVGRLNGGQNVDFVAC